MKKTKKQSKIDLDNLIAPEVEEAVKEYEMRRNILDRIPAIPAGENYMKLRYPVRYNFSRADLQELAVKNIKRLLKESEIEQLEDYLMDSGRAFEELAVAIIDAIRQATGEKSDGPYVL